MVWFVMLLSGLCRRTPVCQIQLQSTLTHADTSLFSTNSLGPHRVPFPILSFSCYRQLPPSISIRILRYRHSAGPPALRSSLGLRLALRCALLARLAKTKMRSAARLRSGLRVVARLGSSGRSQDAPGTLRSLDVRAPGRSFARFVRSARRTSNVLKPSVFPM